MSTELQQRVFEITVNAYNLKAQLDDLQAIKTILAHTLEDVQNINAHNGKSAVNTESQLRVVYLAFNALTEDLKTQIESLDTNSGVVHIMVNSPRVTEFLHFQEKKNQEENSEGH